MEVTVPTSLYPAECVLLSVQPYLKDHHVAVAPEGDLLRVTVTPRVAATTPVDEQDYLNQLQYAVFRWRHERNTAELRRLLLERAFALPAKGERHE